MFPIDPKAPSKQKSEKWKRVEKACLIFSTLLGTISLFYAVISFSLSQKAYETTENQFEINSKESEKQFNQISSLLNSYQHIADSSLLIIKEQLLTNRKQLSQQISSSKPNVGLFRTEYYIKEEGTAKKVGVLITLTNSGVRTAENVIVKTKYISNDLILLHENLAKSMDLIPMTPKTTFEELITPLRAKVEYFLLISVSYFDPLLKEKTITNYVLKPSTLAPTFEEVDPKLKTEILKRFN